MSMGNNRFEQLMQINQDAFSEGHYNTAYHALVTALHCAQDHENLEGILKVGETAQEQGQHIDRHAPDYEHSSVATKARGIVSSGIYPMLANQAQSAARLRQLGRNSGKSSKGS